MDVNKSELFVELFSFFQDINKFLHNLKNNESENVEKLDELYEKSDYLLKVFTLSSSQEVTGDHNHAYLNMTVVKKSDQLGEEIYDYCAVDALDSSGGEGGGRDTSKTDVGSDVSKVCPYARLSRSNLEAEQPSIVDDAIIQLDRRSLFGKPKSVHAALIGRWFLIYLTATDQKPTQIIHVTKYETIVDKLMITILNNKGKAYKFQMGSKLKFEEWISVIEKNLQPSRDRHSYVNVVDKRKLPTPPQSTFRPKSSKSDDIYEEPDLLNHDKSLYKNLELSNESSDEPKEPPALPEKRGQRDSLEFTYDVPRNNRPVEPSSPQSTPTKTPPLNPSPVKNSEEIRQKILQQGITLNPITPPESPIRSPSKDFSRQSIRMWFRTKLNNTKKEEKLKSTTSSSAAEVAAASMTVGGAKMGRVNAIIQQLETSKHFLKKRHTMYDDSYEPMNHENLK